MRKTKLCNFYTIFFIAVFMLVACKKEANNDTNINNDLLNWIKVTTDIPVYLPNKWEPIKMNGSKQNYYIEAIGGKDNYTINVYRTKEPVKFNDKDDLLEKNGPISESDFIGYVSGGIENNTNISLDIPKDSKSFELIKGVKAYEKDDGLSMWWSQHDWNIVYNGSSNLNALQNFATALSNADITVADTGNIIIAGGNKLTFTYEWEKDGQKYSFVTQDTDIENTIEILNSFIKIN